VLVELTEKRPVTILEGLFKDGAEIPDGLMVMDRQQKNG
jgi:hypothetical protein